MLNIYLLSAKLPGLSVNTNTFNLSKRDQDNKEEPIACRTNKFGRAQSTLQDLSLIVIFARFIKLLGSDIYLMSNQKKLVQALKVFMDRTVAPVLGEGHSALNQWKYLSGILSTQLDFYLLMANKGSNSNTATTSTAGQKATFTPTPISVDKFALNRYPANEIQSPLRPKATFGGQSQRKQLLGNTINFQATMAKNQQKIQTFAKKQPNTSVQVNTSSNTSYAGSKKFM